MQKYRYLIAVPYDDRRFLPLGFVSFFTKMLSSNFRVRDVHRDFPPRITLKAPFALSASKERALRRVLRSYAARQRPFQFRLDCIRSFGTSLIYWGSAKRVARFGKLVRGLRACLRSRCGVEPVPRDFMLRPKVTLAKEDIGAIFAEIRRFVADTFRMNAPVTVDRFCLYRSGEDGAWSPVAEFRFNS